MGGLLMVTLYTDRLLLIVPVARIAGFAAWWAARVAAGQLEYDNPAVWPELVPAAGADDAPASHQWSYGCYTRPQLKIIAGRLAALTGITLPANWDTLTHEQRKQWGRSKQEEILAAVGVLVVPEINTDATWDRTDDALTAMSLKRRIARS